MKQRIKSGQAVSTADVPEVHCAHCGLTDHTWAKCPYYYPNRKPGWAQDPNYSHQAS